jgi:hypothetical protein
MHRSKMYLKFNNLERSHRGYAATRDDAMITFKGVEADMDEPEKHVDDSATAALRPLAWVILFAIGCVSLLLLLKHLNVF